MSKDELQIDVTGADATETTETFKATEAGEVVEAATETVVQEQDFPETLVMEAETIKESISDSAATPVTQCTWGCELPDAATRVRDVLWPLRSADVISCSGSTNFRGARSFNS